MKHLSVLIKPASSLCNLRCKYCFYADISSQREVKSYGIMKIETMKRIIDNIYKDLEDGDHFHCAFQGGEPTLAGLEFFQELVEYIAKKTSKIKVHYVFQTNGLLLNDQWCKFFRKNNFLVGLSIDGDCHIHDQNRVDTSNNGTYARVIKAKELLSKNGVEYNILCVLTNQLALQPDKVFEFIKEENIRYIQFIPCLDDLGVKVSSAHSLKPENFAYFYNRLFILWSTEFKKNNYISINMIDNIINLIAHRVAGSCGMLGICQMQYIIEADGGVYPCDFYVLDQFYVGNVMENTLTELKRTQKASEFLAEKTSAYEYCEKCRYLPLCNGGCKRMKGVMYINEKEDYCGYKTFLDKNHKELIEIAKTQI